MNVLLDTNVLLWAVAGSSNLDVELKELLRRRDNDVLFSAASIWEMAIKAALRRSDFVVDPERVALEASRIGFTERPVRASVAAMVAQLPLHHRDPFDRVIVAQAMSEPAHLYTSDPVLARYSDLVTVIRRPA